MKGRLTGLQNACLGRRVALNWKHGVSDDMRDRSYFCSFTSVFRLSLACAPVCDSSSARALMWQFFPHLLLRASTFFSDGVVIKKKLYCFVQHLGLAAHDSRIDRFAFRNTGTDGIGAGPQPRSDLQLIRITFKHTNTLSSQPRAHASVLGKNTTASSLAHAEAVVEAVACSSN